MFMFIKKYFTVLFIILFIIFFSIFNKEEFLQHYKNKTYILEQEINLEKSISNFRLENIKDIKNTKFYYTPNKKLLDKIINKINISEERIFLEVYILTEKRIQKALVKAKNRWVEVKVILEKNPYKATHINNKSFKYLYKSWVEIVWSNTDLYTLNHSKFIIIDNEVIVSTWNFSYSTFAFNRDLFLFIKDKNILNKFKKIFSWDFEQKNNLVYDDNLVLSPDYSRDKISIMFEESNKSLDLYFQYLKDSNLEKLLIQKTQSWVKIRIIVSERFLENNPDKVYFLEKKWIKIKALKSAKMHSKAILVDNKYLFIWSINFSRYSLDKNRETGIILTNKDIIKNFRELFEKDFAK